MFKFSEIPVSGLYASAFSLAGSAVMKQFPAVDWIAYSLWSMAFIFSVMATSELISRHFKWRFHPTWSFKLSSLLPLTILIPLEKAAQTAYEKLDGTLTATAAVKMATPEGPVNYMATSIAHSIPLYGIKPHHIKLKLIDKEKIGLIKNNGKNTTAIGGQIILFDNLHVSHNDYKKYLHEKLNEHAQGQISKP